MAQPDDTYIGTALGVDFYVHQQTNTTWVYHARTQIPMEIVSDPFDTAITPSRAHWIQWLESTIEGAPQAHDVKLTHLYTSDIGVRCYGTEDTYNYRVYIRKLPTADSPQMWRVDVYELGVHYGHTPLNETLPTLKEAKAWAIATITQAVMQ